MRLWRGLKGQTTPWVVVWAELCPLKADIQVLTPSTDECDLTWQRGLGRRNQIKRRLN